MRFAILFAAGLVTGWLTGRLTGWWLSEHYWLYQDEKTRAVTFFFYEMWGTTIGAVLGFIGGVYSQLRKH